MSVICKKFVQNTWRKDLCSNCFKSEEEHGEGIDGGKEDPGRGGQEAGLLASSYSKSRSSSQGGHRRYMGVAGKVYQRGYYNNSWKSIMIDKSDGGLKSPGLLKSDTGLRSPGLIKEMSSLVSQENEKNLLVSDLVEAEEEEAFRGALKASQSEARLLTEILAENRDSDDLGSEGSTAASSSSSSSVCSLEVTNSETASLRSEGERTLAVPPAGILKKTGQPSAERRAISFNPDLEEVIGFGGDVDYSDDDEDEDDDEDYDDLADLTPDERVLRQLTDKNTEFNSDNDNLKKDIEELLPSVKELEEKRKMIIAEIEELERLGRERMKKEEKQEGKVKLKRSPPLVSSKPLIARNNNEVRVNQVLPMKNGQVVRPSLAEDAPLKGVKPKYVPREQEMVEKSSSAEEQLETGSGKITSIDEVYSPKEAASASTTTGAATRDEVYTESRATQSQKLSESEAASPPSEGSSSSSSENSPRNDGGHAKERKHQGLAEAKDVPRTSVESRSHQSASDSLGQKETPSPTERRTKREALRASAAPSGSSVVSERHASSRSTAQQPPDGSATEARPPGESTTTESKVPEYLSKTSTSSRPGSSGLPKVPDSSLASEMQSSQDPPESSSTARNESLSEDKTVYGESLPEPSGAPSNGNISESLSNETLARTPSAENLPDASKSSSNERLPEGSKSPSNESRLESTTTSSSQMLPEVPRTQTNQSVPETARIPSGQNSSEMESSPSNSGHPEASRTSSRQIFAEKCPASRQDSNSSLMTTFGTPLVTPAPTSFLHSPCVPTASPLHAPETRDFLREIQSQPEVRAPTAGIQKSALYASTSCLKGLPGAKPVITPKPPKLKDKPRVPLKAPSSGSVIYATPSLLPAGTLSAAVSTPDLASAGAEDGGDARLQRPTPEGKRPTPPTTQAPAVPSNGVPPPTEVVYDVPVTLASTSERRLQETLSAELKRDDATIYHEIDESIRDASASGRALSHQESTRCQGRSAFEANRTMLSAALDFGVKTLRSSSSKRPAPPPPEEEEEEEASSYAPEASASPQEPPATTGIASHDGESFSSFTDDFDDENLEQEEEQPPLRKAERSSSSALPQYRNSIASFVTQDLKEAVGSAGASPADRGLLEETELRGISGAACGKPQASRSHSVPRATEHVVSVDPTALCDASTSSTSSKFTFRKCGFFQPSSPSSSRRPCDPASERGRDRSSKKASASRFSLKKLLRLGSGGKDGEKREAKEQEKRAARESKKNKLTIIHPLDYNQTGVQVIARPEKTSPIYDYSGIYGYIPPPQLSSKLEDVCPSMTQATTIQESPALSDASKRSDGACRRPSFASPSPNTTGPLDCDLQEKGESTSGRERQESGTSHSSSGTNYSNPQHHLGYNSEGRPKPPPPPRKVSLESGQTCDMADPQTALHPHHSSSPSPGDTPARPQRPPPPVRTPSNAGTKSGPRRPEPPKLTKDSVYANLGDVRAPIMPQKPGRSASVRGQEDRERRRAPQPPSAFQQVGQEVEQQATQRRGSRHQQQENSSSAVATSKAGKGPAPARPPHAQQASTHYDASPAEDNALDFLTEGTTSAPSSRQEKTGRVSVRRGSAVRHRSLEDQYGAVISANLEALSNMLDKLCSLGCVPAGYEEVCSGVSGWDDISVDEEAAAGAGTRLFYRGVARGRDVTVMVTPETQVDAHHLLNPVPVAAFKGDVPSHLLSDRRVARGRTTFGTVWVLPPLSLTTLRRLAEEGGPSSSSAPVEWEHNACLLLLQFVTGLKQLQAQGVEETSLDLALVARGNGAKEQDSNPRLILVPPTEAGRLMSLCQCAAAATLLLMGVEDPLQRAREGSFTIPDAVPSPHAFNILLQLLHQEKAGSLTQVKCVLEVLLFGPDSSENDSREGEEVEAALQRWLDLERATVLHSLIQGPLESSVLTKFHLLFLVRTNSRVLRETLKLLRDPEVTTF